MMSKIHFHQGELALQNKYDIQHDPRLVEQILKDHIVDRFVPFIEQQSTIIVGTTDQNGNLWTSMLIGEIGLIKVTTPQQIDINLAQLSSTKTEILFQNIPPNSQIGLLLIDTATRSRYRLNGRASLFPDRIEITISEAYPNCPKYIQQRIPIFSEDKAALGVEETKGTLLNTSHKQWIRNADTFFMSSKNANGDMDASHRGGGTGFIELLEDGTLKIPDYVGNDLFNSLGNFIQVPKAGLLFIDFEKGHSLQLSGQTELIVDQVSKEDLEKTTGTGRYWLFKTQKWIQTSFHNKVAWRWVSFSPFNPPIK